MRTAILISAYIIAKAINPELEFKIEAMFTISLCFFIMIEFFIEKHKE